MGLHGIAEMLWHSHTHLGIAQRVPNLLGWEMQDETQDAKRHLVLV